MRAILCLSMAVPSRRFPALPAALSSNLPHLFLGLASALTTCVLLSDQAFAQGFAGRGSRVRITQKLPPRIYIGGNSFSVEVTSDQQVSPQVLGLVRNKITDGIGSKLPRLAPAEAGADTSISCSIQSLHSSSRQTSWTTTEYQRTGQHTVHDDATNTDQTVDDYGYVSVTHYGTLVEGDISAWYQVTDRASSTVLDSAQLSPTYSQTFEGGSSIIDPFGELAARLATEIVTRLTPSSQTIGLALPKGQLSKAGRLFVDGRWDQALDALERMPPLRHSEDDSYRIYLIGVIKEWLGYYASDPSLAKELIEKSIADYTRAGAMKPRETVFSDAAARAAAAAREYSGFLDQARALQALQNRATNARSSGQAATQRAGSTLLGVPPAGVQPVPVGVGRPGYYGLSNEHILAWIRLGAPEREILARIKTSGRNTFDLSPGALYELRQAQASDAILQAMQQQQGRRARSRTGLVVLGLALAALQYLPWVFR